jgi:predicted permease
MVALGYLAKRIGLFPYELAKPVNKLVFRMFLPAMLFLNIYKLDGLSSIRFGYVAYSIVAVLVVFAVAVLTLPLVTKRRESKGALLQATFRSNFALIGLPLATSLFGNEGAAVAAILSAFTIPAFNVLAVIALSMYSTDGKNRGIKKILLGIAKNPLIISVLCGVLALALRALFESLGIGFRLSSVTPVYKALGYLSDIATPLALLVLGVQFEFSAVKSLRREIIFGTLSRIVIVPFLALGFAVLVFRDQFGGAEFAALVALFATPVAVSSVPMAQEMNADYTLAGQLVVWTTLLSSVTVFIIAFILSYIGIFPVL